MNRFKRFFMEYLRVHLSSRIMFYGVGFGEIFFLMLLFRLLTNSSIDLKFLLDVIIVTFTCFLVSRFLVGDYNQIKSKFLKNFKQ